MQVTNRFCLLGRCVEVTDLKQAQALLFSSGYFFGKLFIGIRHAAALFNDRSHLIHTRHELTALLGELSLGIEIGACRQLLFQRGNLPAHSVVVVHQAGGVRQLERLCIRDV